MHIAVMHSCHGRACFAQDVLFLFQFQNLKKKPSNWGNYRKKEITNLRKQSIHFIFSKGVVVKLNRRFLAYHKAFSQLQVQ